MRTQAFPGRAERSDNRKYVCLRKLKVARMRDRMAFSEALGKEAINQANTVIFQIKHSIEVSRHGVYGQ